MNAAGKVEPAAAADDEDGPLYTFDDAPIGEPLSDEERAMLEGADLSIGEAARSVLVQRIDHRDT
jgi:hypothetical protein